MNMGTLKALLDICKGQDIQGKLQSIIKITKMKSDSVWIKQFKLASAWVLFSLVVIIIGRHVKGTKDVPMFLLLMYLMIVVAVPVVVLANKSWLGYIPGSFVHGLFSFLIVNILFGDNEWIVIEITDAKLYALLLASLYIVYIALVCYMTIEVLYKGHKETKEAEMQAKLKIKEAERLSEFEKMLKS